MRKTCFPSRSQLGCGLFIVHSVVALSLIASRHLRKPCRWTIYARKHEWVNASEWVSLHFASRSDFSCLRFWFPQVEWERLLIPLS